MNAPALCVSPARSASRLSWPGFGGTLEMRGFGAGPVVVDEQVGAR